MRKALRKSLVGAVIISESTHIFCCVFPTVFSLMGLLAGLGVTVMPAFMVEAHDLIHRWEVPIIAASGVFLVLGWAAVLYSDKIDCHSTGCAHGACAPKKSRSHTILTIATVLFVINMFVYITIHKSGWFFPKGALQAVQPSDHAHSPGE